MICLETSCGDGAGLGNQLFRYAFARALQLDTGEPIVMYDYHRVYDKAPHTRLSLPKIVPASVNITYVDMPGKQVGNYFKDVLPLRYYFYLVIQKLWRYTHGIWGKPTVQQIYRMNVSLHPLMNRLGIYMESGGRYVPYTRYRFPKKFYCLGYFFSSRFFSAHAAQIRDELNRPELISDRNAALVEEMRSCNAVAVHIRLGDFVDDPHFRNFLYVCSPEYYRDAVAAACRDLNDPVFYVFTNDRKKVMQFPFPAEAKLVFVPEGNSAIEDLELMAQCRHFVIPNSTFSWWGQFLSRNPDKKVYGPSRWFRFDAPDDPNPLIEPTWTIIRSELPPI